MEVPLPPPLFLPFSATSVPIMLQELMQVPNPLDAFHKTTILSPAMDLTTLVPCPRALSLSHQLYIAIVEVPISAPRTK